MRSQVPQAHSLWEVMFYQVTGRLGKQYLSSVASAHDACSAMDVQADVPFGGKLRLARMQADAHTHGHPVGPGMSSKGTLHLYCRCDSIGGTGKGHQEGIALGVDFVTAKCAERATHQGSALC